MDKLFFTPHFRWDRFLATCVALAISATFLGRWVVFDFFHGSLTAVLLIKVLLDAGVLTQKKAQGKSPLRKVK